MNLTGATRLAAVIGDPVRHSRSPAIHNAAYAATGLDWVFVALPVPAGRGADAVRAMPLLGIAGLSVTMPHKADAARACDELSPDAMALGAVNTVVLRDGGALAGDSTDGEGLLRSLAEAGLEVAGRQVLVVGAGGAARAAVLSLGRAGAAVTVAARRREAAEAAAALGPGAGAAALDEGIGRGFDVVLNATPIGMAGDRLPVATPGPGQWAVDLVYHPEETPFLAAAAAAGARVIGGLGMLVHQAALGFEAMTGRAAPLEAMWAGARAPGSRGRVPLNGAGPPADNAGVGLQGTLDTFSLAEVLGLIEHARQTGALAVTGPAGHGTLYTTAGRFCAGEAADYSGPVDDRHALDVRLIDVCFHLFRFEAGAFEFTANVAPPWKAERATDIAPIVETCEEIVRAWPAVEAVLPSFDVRPELAADLPEDSLTLSRTGFKIFTMIDGRRTVRQIAREAGHSVVEVGPVLRDLIEHGAVRIEQSGPTSRGEPGVVLPSGALHAVRESSTEAGREPIEMVTSVPDDSAPLDGEALERERAELAARAGLQSPGPVPEAGSPGEVEPPEPEEKAEDTAITSDRGALLRLFSGLRDEN